MLRRLSVDPVLIIAMLRGERDHLDDVSRRMLLSVERRARVALTGLRLEDVEPLATALGVDGLDRRVRDRLFESTGGHTLYLQQCLATRKAGTGQRTDGLLSRRRWRSPLETSSPSCQERPGRCCRCWPW